MNSDVIAREGTAMWISPALSKVRTIIEPLWDLFLNADAALWMPIPSYAAIHQSNAETLGLHPWGAGKKQPSPSIKISHNKSYLKMTSETQHQ